jgi:hypothetical protein
LSRVVITRDEPALTGAHGIHQRIDPHKTGAAVTNPQSQYLRHALDMRKDRAAAPVDPAEFLDRRYHFRQPFLPPDL